MQVDLSIIVDNLNIMTLFQATKKPTQ